MRSPAAGHAELFAGEPAAAERSQHRFDLSANVRSDPHAAFSQRSQERLGHSCAEQDVHMKIRHVACERLHRKWTKQDFPSSRLHAAPPGYDEQARGRIEQRRNALLPDGNSDQHAWRYAEFMPAPNWRVDNSRSRSKSAMEEIADPGSKSIKLQNATGDASEPLHSASSLESVSRLAAQSVLRLLD